MSEPLYPNTAWVEAALRELSSDERERLCGALIEGFRVDPRFRAAQTQKEALHIVGVRAAQRGAELGEREPETAAAVNRFFLALHQKQPVLTAFVGLTPKVSDSTH